MEPTRKGFGKSLANNGDDERIVCLGLDISGSITISDFYAGKPERKNRWISMGIAEQSATAAAAGLAREGKLPVFGTYATFAAARNLDQIRVSICYGNFNVLIAGAHGGVSVGPDGATHQALEDLFAMCGLPNMVVSVPCDCHRNAQGDRLPAAAARRAEVHSLRARGHADRHDEKTRRLCSARQTSSGCVARRSRWSMPSTRVLASEYRERTRRPEHHRLRADGSRSDARGLHPEAGVRLRDARAQHPHHEADRRGGDCARGERNRRGRHRRGAPDRRAGVARERQSSPRARELFGTPVITGAIGVKDRFGDSGAPWELIKEFEVSAEHIAQKAAELMAIAKVKKEEEKLVMAH